MEISTSQLEVFTIKDLRHGNIVRSRLHGNPICWVTSQLLFNSPSGASADISDFMPCPITDIELGRYGFEETKPGFWEQTDNDVAVFLKFKEYTDTEWEVSYADLQMYEDKTQAHCLPQPAEYMHEVQNIYRMLTGSELLALHDL